jgi:hypothetical protein
LRGFYLLSLQCKPDGHSPQVITAASLYGSYALCELSAYLPTMLVVVSFPRSATSRHRSACTSAWAWASVSVSADVCLSNSMPGPRAVLVAMLVRSCSKLRKSDRESALQVPTVANFLLALATLCMRACWSCHGLVASAYERAPFNTDMISVSEFLQCHVLINL